MKTDTLGRRLRYAPPAPKDGFVLVDDDFLILEAINRHGPLPANYLFEFQKHKRKNYTNIQRRLTKLFNGDERGGYLAKPEQQQANYKALSQSLIYTLSQRGLRALAERGTLAVHPPTGSAWFLHQFMQACVAASFELTAPSKGLTYVSREQLLKQFNNPMAMPLPNGRKLIPDDYFALATPDGKKRHFRVEIDRATESMKPYENERKSQTDPLYFGGKLTSYINLMRDGSLKSHVLIITTTPTRARQIIDHLVALNEPQYAKRFAVTVEPTFGINWRVPTAVLSHLLDEPWQTVNGLKDITQP